VEALDNGNIPFSYLAERHKELRRNSGPVPSNVFFETNYREETSLAPLGKKMPPIKNPFDLQQNVLVAKENMKLFFTYNMDLFDQAAIEKFLKHYYILLKKLITDPKKKIADY